MALRDYYSILNIPRNATEKEIKKAYRNQAKKFHPDSSDAEGSEDIFKEINEAYKVLSNAKKKKEYDASFSKTKQSPPHRRKTYRPPPEASRSAPFKETAGRDKDSKRIWREHNASLRSQSWSAFGKRGGDEASYSSFKYFQNQPSKPLLGILVGISLAVVMFIFVFWVLKPIPFNLLGDDGKDYNQRLADEFEPPPFYLFKEQQDAQNLHERLSRESISQLEKLEEDFDRLSKDHYSQDPDNSQAFDKKEQYEEDNRWPQNNYQDNLLDDIWEDIEDQASDTSDF
jgi:curved DNA-binding protein CbpA